MRRRLVLTCEHAGNRVPAKYRPLFRGAGEALASHRGWDPGSLALGRTFERRLAAPLVVNEVTRLLVEANRSEGHRSLFSEFTAHLPAKDKREILAHYYLPHRRRVEEHIAAALAAGEGVVHISVHTFTPVFAGIERACDIGLLYDPARRGEVEFCTAWRAALHAARPDLRVRRNYPYLGKADGFTTHLRRRFPAGRYVGVELEVNQKWPLGPAAAWKKLQEDLAESFQEIALN